MKRTDAAYRGLGAVLSYNCTPYIATNVPNFGEGTFVFTGLSQVITTEALRDLDTCIQAALTGEVK